MIRVKNKAIKKSLESNDLLQIILEYYYFFLFLPFENFQMVIENCLSNDVANQFKKIL